MKGMRGTQNRAARYAAAAGLALFLVAGVLPGQAAGQTRFSVAFLASNRPGVTDNTDSRLVDPWGLTAMRAGPWWIADRGRLTAYTGEGLPMPVFDPVSVSVPVAPGGVAAASSPTGLVFNDSAGFEIEPSAPAWFITVTRGGQVDGWFPGNGTDGAVIMSDQGPDAGFTGAALAGARLYAANFRQNSVDAFADDFSPADLGPSAFSDPALPAGLAPYNVQVLGGRIYVTYAAPDDSGRFAVPGTGSVAVFDRSGRLLLTLQPGPWMNAPWGVALAPAGFGEYGRDVLVANTGSGRISVFDPEGGSFRGYLTDLRGLPVTIRGLHGLGFGNDDAAGSSSTLYFTAGPDGGTTGIFGSVTPVKAE